jgi:glucose/arabinose dehydrogenase
MRHSFLRAAVRFALFCAAASSASGAQTSHTLAYGAGKSISLSLPDSFDISVAASGLRRVRFFAQAPDGRIFVTGMHDLSDNRLGSVFILDGWDSKTQRFAHVIHYLGHLRNPNNLAFWTDPATNQTWLYLPLTDKLVRYRYNAGDNAPSSGPETLMHFPDYGLSYKYGGWHLTRTVAVAQVHGATRVLIAAGSSCNYCQEREVLRAAVISIDPDGKNPSLVAQGMRNAVDMHSIAALNGSVFATNMGDDHLGDQLPEDTFFQLNLTANAAPNYGWPTCYFAHGKPVHDTTALPKLDEAGAIASTPTTEDDVNDSVYGKQSGVAAAGVNLTAGGGHVGADPNAALGNAPAPLGGCEKVPPAYTTFAAHSSPLGFEYFGDDDLGLKDSFLVALHGASRPHIGTGYRVARFSANDRAPHDFITGFLTVINGKPVVHGRPCGILRTGPDSFLLTDDYLGLVYSIHPKTKPAI